MKTITIEFTNPTIVSDYCLGKIGEHNATELLVTPPTILSEDSRTAMYRIAFYTRNASVLSEAFTDAPITIKLWQQLTRNAKLCLQVIAYDSEGEFIGKSARLSDFYFEPSVNIEETDITDDEPDIAAEIAKNTAARHTHSNKDILDDITFTVPNTVNGKSADNNHEIQLDASDISATSGWTPSDDTDLATKKYVDDNAGEKTYEILSSTPSVSNYTGAELWALFQAGKRITYKNIPISYGNTGASGRFIFSTLEFNSEGDPGYRALNFVNASKVLSEKPLAFFIKQINGVEIPSNGSVTVTADKIKAPNNWAPTDEKDIATKKYVDDNAGGVTEKVLELDNDYVEFAVTSQMIGNGIELVLMGDQTGAGGLLHNARISGIEGYISGQGWNNALMCYASGDTFILCNMPIVFNDGSDDWTIIGYTTNTTQSFEDVTKVRIHYIELDGIETVTP